jgi:hypothetical protein
MMIGRVKPKNSEKTCPIAAFIHHKPHMLCPDRRGGKPATNRLNYGTALRGSGSSAEAKKNQHQTKKTQQQLGSVHPLPHNVFMA